jgi:hypothetical protein
MTEQIETLDTAPEIHYDEVTQTNGHIQPKIFRYKITPPSGESQFLLSVIATSATVAKEAIIKHLPDHSFHFDGVSDHILQCNE